MNGLKVIELMQQGKKMKNTTSGMVYWIENGKLRASRLNENGTLSPNKLVLRFNFPFNSHNFEEYMEPKSLTGWEKVSKDGLYYFIDEDGDVWADNGDWSERSSSLKYENANYFSTKEKAKEIDFKQTLLRKLQRFSDENGGNELNLADENVCKYFIGYDLDESQIEIDFIYGLREFGQVYFISEEVTKQTIELFHDDLIKYFTM